MFWIKGKEAFKARTGCGESLNLARNIPNLPSLRSKPTTARRIKVLDETVQIEILKKLFGSDYIIGQIL